jgi:hypothetical protein
MPPIALTRDQRRQLARYERIQEIQEIVLADPVLLCEVVAHGPTAWRNACAQEWPSLSFDHDTCNAMFLAFSLEVRRRFTPAGVGVPPSELDPQAIASKVLDAIEPETPPTDKEIEEAWVVDSASSEDGRKTLYGDRHPQEYLDKLIEGATPHDLKPN